ncbi:unannotated protein [freshwater metagenome]|uniref:Unannotated protein n=1 Tax=freshwater metagenome TaxID=449393 RepID=A0A6J7JLL3_9ZZZZ
MRAHIGFSKFHVQALGEELESSLTGGVCTHTKCRHVHAHRRHVDDVAAISFEHVGKHRQSEPHGRKVIDGHNAFDIVGGHLIGALAFGNAGIVDEHIDATIERSNQLSSECLDCIEISEISDNHRRFRRCGLAVFKHIGQTVGAPSNDRDSGSALRGFDRKRFANAGRCSSDDDVLAGEVAHLLVPVTLFKGIADAVAPADFAWAGEGSALGVVGD